MRIRPLVADTSIAVALTTVAVLLGQESARQGWPELDPWGYALVALANLPVAFRSRAPLAVLLLVHLVWAGYVTAGYWPVVNTFAPMLTVYTVTSLRPARVSLPCAALDERARREVAEACKKTAPVLSPVGGRAPPVRGAVPTGSSVMPPPIPFKGSLAPVAWR